MKSSGKVFLVGAGPGDPGLLTLRAKELLLSCDTVVYDALVNPDLLHFAPLQAERIFVGKRCGKISWKQDEIHALLAERAAWGELVVRLKGGDPFLFGRGGEEAAFLTARGIAWEVVPGVSSALAAPAAAAIPVTHRGLSSSVAIVTAHEHGESAGAVNWNALATAVDTLVVMMGATRLAAICELIIAGGRAPETPAAVVQWGTYTHQRVVHAPLSQIAARATEQSFGSPAVLVVGEVAALGEQLYDQLPRLAEILPAGLADPLSRVPQSLWLDGGGD
jgi:uroporphyrin-III C-methyltransferase